MGNYLISRNGTSVGDSPEVRFEEVPRDRLEPRFRTAAHLMCGNPTYGALAHASSLLSRVRDLHPMNEET